MPEKNTISLFSEESGGESPKDEAHNLPLRELGVSGLRHTFGRIKEEILRELDGMRGIKTYKAMLLNEPYLAASDLIIRLLVRQVDWIAAKAGPTEQQADDRDFLEQNMHDMSHGWDDFIDDNMSMTQFGWSTSEKVYKVRDGVNSKFNDFMVGWKGFPFRSQDSLDRWKFREDTGGIQGFWQRDPNTNREIFIPIGKTLLFRTTQRKNNPQGLSIYRGAYRPYRMKEEMVVMEAIIIEKDGTGTPKFEAPEAYFNKNATSDQKAFIEILSRAASNFAKADEYRGLVVPQGLDKAGNKKYSYDLMSTPGRRTIDIRAVIQGYNTEMLAVALTDFILLGHQKVGSFSLSSDKTNLLSVALGAYLKNIKQVINRWAVPELFELNGMRRAAYPTVEHGDIEQLDLKQIVDSVTKLFIAGFPVENPAEITDMIIERLGLSGAAG